MKNVKKLLKKAMVFTLAASMLVGTPLTASAAGIRGVYSIQDGKSPEVSGTGTVTNTDTGSGALADNDAKIIGIVLDKENVEVVKGNPKKETLTATVVLDGKIYGKDENGEDVDITEDIRTKLAAKIRWELSFSDGSKDENPAATVSIKSPTDENGKIIDKSVVELNPRKGTDKDRKVVVTAKINNSYYVNDQGQVLEYVRPVGTYEASATVSVKEYTEELIKADMDTAYVKHTLDMKQYITRKPATANDVITWSSTNTKVATVTDDGVVTFKKVNTKEEDGELVFASDKDACQIIAVGELGDKAYAEWDVLVVEGVQSSKIEIVEEPARTIFAGKKTSVDLRDVNDDWAKEVGVQMYKTMKVVVKADGTPATTEAEAEEVKKPNGKYPVKNATIKNGDPYVVVEKVEGVEVAKAIDELDITDIVTWLSSKPAIVSVEDNEGDNDTGAVLTAHSVGKAVITAKASSGKTDKLTVTVKATLSGLEIAVGVDDDKGVIGHLNSYSGKSYQLYARKTPEQSKDAVKWSIAKVEKKNNDGTPVLDKNNEPKMIANPNATINAKGVLTIKPKLDPVYLDQGVTVELKSAKPVETGAYDDNNKPIKAIVEAKDPLVVDIKQSSVDGISVTDDADKLIADVYVATNGKVKVNDKDRIDTNITEISVSKSRTYTASVVGTEGYENGVDTLTWTTSNAKIASVEYAEDGTAKITANANGTATITVSGVRVTTKNGKVNANAIKTTFKVSVKQPVKTVTLNKPSVVLNVKADKKGNPQNQKVALQATLGPKGVDKKTAVKWDVKKDGVSLDKTVVGLVNNKGEITTAKINVTLPTPEVGDEFVITATTDSGAYAKSTVKIVEKTNNVVIQNDAEEAFVETETKPNGSVKTYNNTKWLAPGTSAHMNVMIGVKTGNDVVLKKAGTENREDVTYTVNKKGIVRIDDNGNVYALKAGTVKITAKAPLSKKAATLTVVVK